MLTKFAEMSAKSLESLTGHQLPRECGSKWADSTVATTWAVCKPFQLKTEAQSCGADWPQKWKPECSTGRRTCGPENAETKWVRRMRGGHCGDVVPVYELGRTILHTLRRHYATPALSCPFVHLPDLPVPPRYMLVALGAVTGSSARPSEAEAYVDMTKTGTFRSGLATRSVPRGAMWHEQRGHGWVVRGYQSHRMRTWKVFHDYALSNALISFIFVLSFLLFNSFIFALFFLTRRDTLGKG